MPRAAARARLQLGDGQLETLLDLGTEPGARTAQREQGAQAKDGPGRGGAGAARAGPTPGSAGHARSGDDDDDREAPQAHVQLNLTVAA